VVAVSFKKQAEHYFRLIAAAQEQFRQNQPQQPRSDNEMASEDGDDDSESFSHFGQEPGFVPVQPQPFVRDNNQRDNQREGQSYQPRDQHQPREHGGQREHRQQPQYQPQPQSQPQPAIPENVSVDRLPSFITGPQPQINGGFEGGGGERFPRRRRRPHGPRPDNVPAPATSGGDDFNPGNE